jgi:predicted nucleic acid-binding protein
MEGKGAWACGRVRKGCAGRDSQRSVTFAVSTCLYLDTSAVLRAILENGTSPQVEALIAAAPALVTSRLSLVESSRALHRLRQLGQVNEAKLADAQREISAVWARCELWELTPLVCERARQVAPGKSLRTLDALHLATFVLAREKIEGLELVTVDDRLQAVLGAV